MRFFTLILAAILLLTGLNSCQNAKFLKAHSNPEHKRKRVFEEHIVTKNTIELNKKKKKEKQNKAILCADSIWVPVQNYSIDSDIAYGVLC